MADLNEEIAVLKAEIEGYKKALNDPSTSEARKDKLIDVIKSSRDNLTELLHQQTAATAPAPAPVPSEDIQNLTQSIRELNVHLTEIGLNRHQQQFHTHRTARGAQHPSSDISGVTNPTGIGSSTHTHSPPHSSHTESPPQ
eukprot:gene34008-38439_t